MKKIFFVMFLMGILILAGCQKGKEDDSLYLTMSYSEGQQPTNCTRDDFYGSFVDTQNWMYYLGTENPLENSKPNRIVFVELNINQWECKPRDNNMVWCDCYIKDNVDTKNVFDGR